MTVENVENGLDKEQLLGIVRHLLGTDRALGFLTQLGERDLKILVASIRERMEAEPESRCGSRPHRSTE